MLAHQYPTSMIDQLVYHHGAVRDLNARLSGPETPMRKYDLEDARLHSAQRDFLLCQMDLIAPTGISAPYTIGVDREAQIEAFLGPPEMALAAE